MSQELRIKCDFCEGTNLLEGPFYDRSQQTCLDCGAMFNREVFVELQPQEVVEQLPMPPAEGFASVEEAKAFAKKLEQAKKRLTGQTVGKEDRPAGSPKSKSQKKVLDKDTATAILPADPLTMLVMHRYSRPSEPWNAVLSSAREEIAYRNNNVKMFAHAHEFGQECESRCKQVEVS